MLALFINLHIMYSLAPIILPRRSSALRVTIYDKLPYRAVHTAVSIVFISILSQADDLNPNFVPVCRASFVTSPNQRAGVCFQVLGYRAVTLLGAATNGLPASGQRRLRRNRLY